MPKEIDEYINQMESDNGSSRSSESDSSDEPMEVDNDNSGYEEASNMHMNSSKKKHEEKK